MNTWVKRALIAIPALIILIYGAIFVYAKVINDPDPKLDRDDLSAAVFGDSSSTGPAGDTTDPETSTAITVAAINDAATSAPITVADTEPTEATSSGATVVTDTTDTTDITAAGTVTSDDDSAGFDGVWAIADGSEFGYRVQEVLGGVDTTATGRGSDITGSITLDGTTVTDGSFEVDVATITSDRSSRDNQFKGRIMSTDEFPTASFVLTEPIDFGTIPSGDDEVVASATGELTLHGTTNSVTFDVTAQASTDRIGVLGEIPVVFADYDIPDASAGPARVGDDGLLEFILVFEPSGDDVATSGSLSADTTGSTESTPSESTPSESPPTESASVSVGGFRTPATASTVADSTPDEATGICTDHDVTATSVDTAAGVTDGAFDGAWSVTDQSTFGYRVHEVLGGVDTTATGRSSEITGTMTIGDTTVRRPVSRSTSHPSRRTSRGGTTSSRVAS